MRKAAKPGKPIPSSVMKKVEASREDRMRDKKMGVKEGSKADRLLDLKQAKAMMKKPNGRA